MLNKSNILYYFTIALFSFLVLRLFQLQILEHQKYKVLAKNDTTRTTITQAPRGIIYDRDGTILATSKQTLSVVIFPAALSKTTEKQKVAHYLSKLISTPYPDLLKLFNQMEANTPLPITLDNDISIETAIKIYENEEYLPGVAVEKQASRYYPLGEAIAHLLGYVGQVNSEELKRGSSRGLVLGDVIGKEGLEKVFDETLLGTKGESRIAVDRYGHILKDSSVNRIIKPAIKGRDLHLTIDADLQRAAYEALKHIDGAAVVMSPRTGEILALVSTPSFDPNIFIKPVPEHVYNQLLAKKVFINRAISAYPPGSIWKPVTMLAGLEHKVAHKDERLRVSGAVYFGGFRFGDWTNKEDTLDLVEALAWSRDTYFYQIGKRMQPEWIASAGRAIGAGSPTGIELVGEAAGIVPDPKWKLKYTKEPWYPGNTLHYAIGQSFLMVTPIQAVKMISTIASSGLVPQPHLIPNKNKEKLLRVKNISLDTFKVVQQGLEMCVDSGTGQASKFPNIKVAGKTGSAEVKGYKHSTHGWFAAYAPAGNPEIAIAVFAEGAGHGGSVAAPIARKIFETYFRKQNGDPLYFENGDIANHD